jgi:hypothetical protein
VGFTARGGSSPLERMRKALQIGAFRRCRGLRRHAGRLFGFVPMALLNRPANLGGLDPAPAKTGPAHIE